MIINLGAGLDTRFYRVDNQKILWYDVDLPRVMDIREELIPHHDRVLSIKGSILEKEWINKVKEESRPVLIIIEGVLQFFKKEEAQFVLDYLAERFPGAYVLFDLCAEEVLRDPKLMKKLTKSDTLFQWGEDDPKEVERMNAQYQLLDFIHLADRMHLKMKIMAIASKLPKVRKLSGKVALYQIKK
ncbi:MAG: class I SAM-dependent methyltransferase [Tissierellia bacterium]|nr:class I SAM-dependent methyltransferase [Tissierellia bacterium]